MMDYGFEVRRQLAALEGAGWSRYAIAGESGIPTTVLWRVANGADPAPNVVNAVMALDPTTLPTKTRWDAHQPFVPRVGTVRRIQGMLWMAWPHHHITKVARSHGCATPSQRLLAQSGLWVVRSTHDAYVATYRELSKRQGPSSRSAAWARKLGYVSPVRWDDIDLDEAPTKDPKLCAAEGCVNTAVWVSTPKQIISSEQSERCKRHAHEDAA